MNKKGQVEQIIGGILVLIIVIPLMSVLISSLYGLNCQDYINQVKDRDSQIVNLKNEINLLNSTATFYKIQYENLTNTNITKKDFTDLKQEINQLNVQINNVQNQINQVNENIITIQNIKTVYRNFVFSFTINIIFIAFLLIDFAIFNFEISKKTIELLVKKIHQLKNWIKSKFKKKE